MDKFLESIACSGTECLCWILVLFNILSIFYLVFCSFWNVNKIVKIVGWVWAAVLLCVCIGILSFHTCIYTLLLTIFTAMMLMAILSVVIPNKSSDNADVTEVTEKLGSYVISKTDDERFAFAIYDKYKKLVVKSKFSYDNVDAAKIAVCSCRDNGMSAAINDKTALWIREEFYPTFEIYAKDGKYRYCLKINGKYTIFESDGFDKIKSCEKALAIAKKMVASTSLYLNTEIVSGKDYLHYIENKPTLDVALDREVVSEPALEEVAIKESDSEIALTVSKECCSGDEETTIIDGKIKYVVYNRSFKSKLIQAPDEIKERFLAIKNEFLQYGAKTRESWGGLSFYVGRNTIAKFGITGKTLSLYLALDTNKYDNTKYNFENVSDLKKYEQTPFRMKIRSNRAVKWANELIADMMQALGKEKKEVKLETYVEPYKTTEKLIKEGLIKKTITDKTFYSKKN